jgi:hypothetical protein
MQSQLPRAFWKLRDTHSVRGDRLDIKVSLSLLRREVRLLDRELRLLDRELSLLKFKSESRGSLGCI